MNLVAMSVVFERKVHVDGYTKIYVHGVGRTTSELTRRCESN